MYLLPWYDQRLILGYESPVEDDKAEQLNAAQTAYWALTINEWRDKMGVDRVAYGDKHVFMLQHVAVAPADLAIGSYNPQAALLHRGRNQMTSLTTSLMTMTTLMLSRKTKKKKRNGHCFLAAWLLQKTRARGSKSAA